MNQTSGRSLLSYVLVRLGELILVVLGISTVLFFVSRMSGDPIALMAAPSATAEQLEHLRDKLGFNDPLLVQYGRFISRVVFLDFGEPLYGEGSALSIALSYLPSTFLLGGSAFLLAQFISIPLGIFSAVRRGKPSTYLAVASTFVLQSMPAFWLGVMLMLLFSATFRLLPAYGAGSWRHLILPAFTLSAFLLAKSTRMIRTSMIDILREQYVQVAYSKGLSNLKVIIKHAFRNALVPVITLMGIDLAKFLGGAIVTEAVFAWPGMGRKLVWAVKMRDYALMQAIVFLVAVIVALMSIITDVVIRLIDPRIQYD